MILIRTTYETVTPESAECGDAADRGWVDQEGTEYELAEAISKLEGCEPSSSMFHVGVWYTQADGETDFRTGAETRESYHVEASETEQRAIFDAITK